ncbi:MAG: SLBB domain-containing protein, partial [Blastocatellia bacterium]
MSNKKSDRFSPAMMTLALALFLPLAALAQQADKSASKGANKGVDKGANKEGASKEMDNNAPPVPKVGTLSDDQRSGGILAAPDADYRIGIGDVLEITIEDAPELSGTYRVNNAGKVPLPDPVGIREADQKTTEELGAAIAGTLREKDYLKHPRVVVGVKQYLSRSIFIQGSVRSPGVYQVEGRPSLLKLIILAGGLSDNHGSAAFIIREIKKKKDMPAAEAAKPAEAIAGEEQYEFLSASIGGLLNGNFDQNVQVEPGDIINIPPAGVFFVAGEVRKPGSFVLRDRTTLRQAISLAEGTTFKASMGHGVIFREDPATGQRKEIPVD